MRWVIAVMLFLAAVLNYIDRNVLGLLAPTIQKDLRISDEQYASVVNWFLAAYTIAYLASGRIVDKLGERVSMALFITWWSIANALTSFASSLGSLSVVRFMLGLGEAGAFTVAPKVVAAWFPPKERGVAVGIYSIGGSVGATIAPLIVTLVAARYGWRYVFAVTPLLALAWVGVWLILYRRPSEATRLTSKERDYLAANCDPVEQAGSEPAGSERALWSRIFAEPAVWRLMIARLLTDPVWYFYQFWMAKYLFTARHLDQKHLSIMWMIFLAADIGFLASGFLAGLVIRRGASAPAARLWVMLAAACLTPLSALIPASGSVAVVIAISLVVVYSVASWLSNMTALIVDTVPRSILGTAFGVIACGSALGGIFMNQFVAQVVTHGSYTRCFYAMAIVHPIALLFVWKLRDGKTQSPQYSLPGDLEKA